MCITGQQASSFTSSSVSVNDLYKCIVIIIYMYKCCIPPNHMNLFTVQLRLWLVLHLKVPVKLLVQTSQR
jgi:hypothetical protein